MRYEIDLIKRKAFMAMDSAMDQEAKTCLVDIIKLADACTITIDEIDTDITRIALDMRRVTTDIK